VDFDIVVEQESPPAESASDTVRDLIESGLAEYVALYGDKTKEPDPVTGTPNVARHYDLEATERGYTVQVHGSTGHMGSILRHDGALTKMSAMVRALVMGRDHLERRMGGPVRFELHNWDDPSYLLMEGGQGFVPTHELAEIKTRLANAVRRGAERYLMLMGHDFRMAARLSVSYDKLHNAAFAGAPDTPAALLAAEEAELAGFAQPSPARGWDVSCDARIFASERPGATVLTVGPGSLSHAHSDNEQVDVGDLARFARFLARFIVRHLGTTRVSDD
jgi:acetylornithine deacetylase/succinyl-diaminopimelate desuccinylase-like protein